MDYLNLAAVGPVYVDTAPLIYTMEYVVKPIQAGASTIRAESETFPFAEGLTLIPMNMAILMRAAEVRAGLGGR